MVKPSTVAMMSLSIAMVMALTHRAAAQSVRQPLTTSTRLITLGTAAGPSLRPDRAQSSSLITVNGTHYVMDAGDGVARRLESAGIDIRDIGIIFVTHHHDDHTAGLGTLVSVAWDRQRTRPIHVYGPPKTAALVNAAVQYFAISAEIRLAEGRTVPLTDVVVGHDVGVGMVYQDANIKVTAVENSHFDFHKTTGVARPHSYSYRFDTPDRVIVFTGDTGPSDAVVALAQGADLLVAGVESYEDRLQSMINSGRWQTMTPAEQANEKRQAGEGHMSPVDVGKMAALAKVKAVVLSHLGPRVGTDDYTPWVNAVKEYFSGQVLLARDLAQF